MNVALIVIAIAAISAWVFIPAFRSFVDGWKTRASLVIAAGLQVAAQVDPALVNAAIGVPPGTAQYSAVVLGLTVCGVLFNEMRNKPGMLSKKK